MFLYLRKKSSYVLKKFFGIFKPSVIFFVSFFFLAVVSGEYVFAGAKNIIVYPSPVNINRESLVIGVKPGYTYSGNLVIKIEIFTSSGDLVYSKRLTSSGFPDIKWRGYDNKGKKVSQGLYIIRIQIENEDTGEVDIKKIRFLVKK